MDKEINKGILDPSYTTNRVILEGRKTKTINGTTLQATYAIDRQLTEQTQIQPMSQISNLDDYQYKGAVFPEKNCWSLRKCFLLCFILIIAFLCGVFFVLRYTSYKAQGTSSSNKYPLLNPDLCDPGSSYYLCGWFTPSPADNFICDVPTQFSVVYIQDMRVYPGSAFTTCLSKLDCITQIGLYFQISDFKFNFFVDHNSNVYQGRGWLCPYKSGQLWVGMILEDPITNIDSEKMTRILKHFNNEIVNYGDKCGFFSSSSLIYNYLNTTFV